MHNILSYNQLAGWKQSVERLTHTLDKTMDEAYDIISNTWKSQFKKRPLDEKTLMAVKKNRGPKSTGVHDLDVITSDQGKLLDAVLTANDGDFSSVSALESALRSASKTADGRAMDKTLGSGEALSTRWSPMVQAICMGFAVMVKLEFDDEPTARLVVVLYCSSSSLKHTNTPDKSALPLFHISTLTTSCPPASTSSALEVMCISMKGSGGGPTSN